MAVMAAAVEARGLAKRYGEVEALRGVELALEKGVGVLLGSNSSGKSTLLKVAAGVAEPDSGWLRVFGEEPYRSRSIKGIIGYMPQDAGLYGQLTGLENYLFYAAPPGLRRGEPVLTALPRGDEDGGVRRPACGLYGGGCRGCHPII